MSKEIAEQPAALRRLVLDGREEIENLADAIRTARKVIVTGCGTAGNAALAGTYLFDEICGRAVTMIPASEFRYRSRTLDSESLVMALSQSGETVDVLDAMSVAEQRGAKLAAIVNTPMSTLDRTVDTRVLLRAGRRAMRPGHEVLHRHAGDTPARGSCCRSAAGQPAQIWYCMLRTPSNRCWGMEARERIKAVATGIAAARASIRDRPRCRTTRPRWRRR